MKNYKLVVKLRIIDPFKYYLLIAYKCRSNDFFDTYWIISADLKKSVPQTTQSIFKQDSSTILFMKSVMVALPLLLIIAIGS